MGTFADFGIRDINSAGRSICPKCSPERKKSHVRCLSVDEREGVWLCHHCGWKGTLKDHDSDSIQEHFEKPAFKKTSLPKNIIEWFSKRGIPLSVLEENSIAYGRSFKDSDGIQFPYMKDGEVVNIKHRSLGKEFRQEKNAEKCLYRLDEISKLIGDTLIITEGEIDTLSFCAAKFQMVTSIPDGAPSADAKTFATKFDFLTSAEPVIEAYSKIILATDNDAPGKLAEKELARRIGPEKCYRLTYPEGCKDANDVLVKHGWEKLREMVFTAKPFPVEGLFSCSDFAQDVECLYDHGSRRGLSTGMKTVDEFYTIKPCEFTVVTGIPSHGKSNFIDALVIGMVKAHGWKFLFFSPENWPVERHLQSLLEKYTEKPFDRHGLRSYRMTKKEVSESIESLKKNIFFLYPEKGSFPVDAILEKARAAVFRHGVNGIVIDPWNELEHQMDGLSEAQYLSRELSKVRQFARRNGVHVWIVAHPRNLMKDKDGSYKPPTMYEISGGAHWRNKADNGLCVYRPDFKIDETTLIVQKIRFSETGKTGEVKLRYCRDNGNYLPKDNERL
jgi:twinkle protein